MSGTYRDALERINVEKPEPNNKEEEKVEKPANKGIEYSQMTAHIRDKVEPYIKSIQNNGVPGTQKKWLDVLSNGTVYEVHGRLIDGMISGRTYWTAYSTNWECTIIDNVRVGLGNSNLILSANVFPFNCSNHERPKWSRML